MSEKIKTLRYVLRLTVSRYDEEGWEETAEKALERHRGNIEYEKEKAKSRRTQKIEIVDVHKYKYTKNKIVGSSKEKTKVGEKVLTTIESKPSVSELVSAISAATGKSPTNPPKNEIDMNQVMKELDELEVPDPGGGDSSENKELREKADRLERENEKLRDRVSQLESQVSEATQQINQNTEEIEATKQKTDRMIDSFTESQEQIIDQLERLEEKIESQEEDPENIRNPHG